MQAPKHDDVVDEESAQNGKWHDVPNENEQNEENRESKDEGVLEQDFQGH